MDFLKNTKELIPSPCFAGYVGSLQHNPTFFTNRVGCEYPQNIFLSSYNDVNKTFESIYDVVTSYDRNH